MKSFAALAALVIAACLISAIRPATIGYRASAGDQPAGVFFTESVSSKDIRSDYSSSRAKDKVKVLIAPGHEHDFGGTAFKGTYERRMAEELGRDVAEYLKDYPRLQVVLSRDESGFNPELQEYFDANWDGIKEYTSSQKQIMRELVAEGEVEEVNTVFHNSAPADVALRLYGINKWANENDVDLAVSIHFNDYPRRSMSSVGTYSGFSIYVPESQFSNAKASKDLADDVFKELGSAYGPSDFPGEKDGIVEDQELIAVGAFNTLDAAGILVEYGYIYERQFQNAEVRTRVLKELALKTARGILAYVGEEDSRLPKTSLLPHRFGKDLKKDGPQSVDTLALQAALIGEGTYPPEGKTTGDCPLTGTYGECTAKAVKAFQDKYGIDGGTGLLVGESTRAKLNELYGN
jgi:N-acetylmuramoyl-L-alanine amidase